MAQPALAYQQPARRTREHEQPRRPPLRALPGRRTRTEVQRGLAPLWRSLFVGGVALALLVGAIWVARVGLANGIMELTIESEQLAHSIELARADGSHLEVQYAAATNPGVILEAAKNQLGMHPDPQVDYLRVQLTPPVSPTQPDRASEPGQADQAAMLAQLSQSGQASEPDQTGEPTSGESDQTGEPGQASEPDQASEPSTLTQPGE